MSPLTYWQPAKKVIVGVVFWGQQNVNQIRQVHNVVSETVKKLALSTRIFSYFTWGIPFETKMVKLLSGNFRQIDVAEPRYGQIFPQ